MSLGYVQSSSFQCIVYFLRLHLNYATVCRRRTVSELWAEYLYIRLTLDILL